MRYLLILLSFFIAACGSYSTNVPSIKPYKMDIQQGNVVTSKMMMQLRPGMTKSQVRFIMGTPLLVDSFHADRWDYFYQMRKDGRIIEQRRVILEFEGDSLAHVRGDVIPAGSDPSAPAEKSQTMQPKSVTKPAQAKEKGLLDKLKFWESDDKGAPKEQPKPAEAAPQPVEATKPAKTEAVKPEVEAVKEPEAAPESAPVEQALPPMMDDVPPAKPDPKLEPKPAAPSAEVPRPAAPREERKGLLDKLKFWDDDKPKATEPTPKPVEAKPAEMPKPAPAKVEPPKPQPAAEKPVPPAPRRPQAGANKPKVPPQPSEDLPPEDAPDFFEKMLEKIGF